MSIEPMTTPQDMPIRFMEAWNRYDAKALADLFSDTPDFVNVTGKWWDNREDIRKAHQFGFDMIFQNSHLEVLKIKKKMLSDTVAVIHARIRVEGQTKNKDISAGRRETMFLFVMQKYGEHWLCESAQNTDIIFGKQTNIRDKDGNLSSVSYKRKSEKITRDLNEEE